MLRQGGRGWEKDLQFFTACLIYLPQLPKLAGLIHILGQPARPEVVNQRPILGYIGRSPHGYCCLYRTHKTMAHYAISCHRTRWRSPCGSNGCTSCRVSWWPNHGPAHTMYMAGHPMVAWPIQAGQLHAHQRSTMQTKGTTSDLLRLHAYGLVCWTRQPFVHISNLAKPHRSFAASFPQT